VPVLVLASQRFACLTEVVGADPADVTVEFVPTAADVLDDHSYLEADLATLGAMGYRLNTLSVADTSRRQVAHRLAAARVVFGTGGNPSPVSHAIRSGFASAAATAVPRFGPAAAAARRPRPPRPRPVPRPASASPLAPPWAARRQMPVGTRPRPARPW
jgi:hypothetical protein